jgi:hypothetical protein
MERQRDGVAKRYRARGTETHRDIETERQRKR